MPTAYLRGRRVADLSLTELLHLIDELADERGRDEIEDAACRAGASTFFTRLQRRDLDENSTDVRDR